MGAQRDLKAMEDVLGRFCRGFQDHDPDVVMSAFALDREPVLITSEDSVVRGEHQLSEFLEGYAAGTTTYSWEWSRTTVAAEDRVGWLFAHGVEVAVTTSGATRTEYRMTMVCVLGPDRWRAVLAHGSSPHGSPA